MSVVCNVLQVPYAVPAWIGRGVPCLPAGSAAQANNSHAWSFGGLKVKRTGYLPTNLGSADNKSPVPTSYTPQHNYLSRPLAL